MTTRSAFTVLTVSSAFAASIAVDVSGCYAQQLRRDVPAEIIRPNPADAPPGDQPQLIYSPWTKFCLKGQEATARQACFTGKDGRVEAGLAVVAAVLIEPENDPKKVLRVTLPLGMSLQQGTRVIVDNGQPMTGPYVICFNNGCMADYEANDELIDKLKKGQRLIIQAINGAGKPVTFIMPLVDFAAAHDGPPKEPAVFASQQEKLLQEKLRKPRRDDTLQRRIFEKSIQQ